MSTVVRPAVQRSPVRWWRRPWVGPLALVAVLFLVYSLPPYLTGDPALSRVQVPSGGVVHYPLLVGHVLFGAVAMLTCCFQVWPAFRARSPRAHRLIGRVYVVAGVLPASVLAPQLPTTFGGDEAFFGATVAGLTTWTGWVLPLLACQWWLDRRTPAAAR